MAKGGIPKPKKGPSLHSRAARRATSPSIDTDKSLKNVKPPQEPIDRRPAVLATYRTSGVTKRMKRKTIMSSKARKRHEKSMDRAEAIIDRTATKIQRSKGSFKAIQSRKKTWDEINKDAMSGEPPAKRRKKDVETQAEDDGAAFSIDGDEDMDEADEIPQNGNMQTGQASPAPASDEEEIL